jgi:hypothetical protein
MQLAPRLSLPPPAKPDRSFYLFNDKLACGICQASPAAPAASAEVMTLQGPQGFSGPVLRCDKHAQAKHISPWPEAFTDPEVMCEIDGCATRGCMLMLVTKVLPIDQAARMFKYATSRETKWLCGGHAWMEMPWVER